MIWIMFMAGIVLGWLVTWLWYEINGRHYHGPYN